MIAAYIHFDLILFKVSIKIYRLISMTTSNELFKMIFKNALIRHNARVCASIYIKSANILCDIQKFLNFFKLIVIKFKSQLLRGINYKKLLN